MAEKSFEDQFDHDPNAVYEEEDDLDLGPDDEFSSQETPAPKKKKGNDVPKGGCLGGLFKVALSLGLIVFCYFYLVNPEKFADIQSKITEIVSAEKHGNAPVLSLKKTDRNAETPTVSKPESVIPPVVLFGAGVLPDFKTSAKQKPDLNSFLIAANKITFETLNTHHRLVKDMIADWTGETDEKKIEAIIQMPYKDFFNRTSASLLAQTLLRHAGLTPVNTKQLISQSPVHAMAAVYKELKPVVEATLSTQEKIRTIEPVSSFFLYICHKDSECLASWDLWIDMLGAKPFAKRLEKAPETIYTGK